MEHLIDDANTIRQGNCKLHSTPATRQPQAWRAEKTIVNRGNYQGFAIIFLRAFWFAFLIATDPKRKGLTYAGSPLDLPPCTKVLMVIPSHQNASNAGVARQLLSDAKKNYANRAKTSARSLNFSSQTGSSSSGGENISTAFIKLKQNRRVYSVEGAGAVI